MNEPLIVDAIPLRREPTSIRELLQSSLALLRQQSAASDISMTVTVDDRVPPVVSLDADKIAWVVTALVGNAMRYVSRGSRVMPGGSIAVRGTYDAARSEVVIEVQDDGPGIPLEKIRDLYSTGANRRRSALGLSLMRDIVLAHGGSMDVESQTDEIDNGATVRVRLPVRDTGSAG